MSKTILITGACGFLGRNLCQYILENTDWTIIAVDYKVERPFNETRVINYRADISCKNELDKIKEPFNYVIHLAAEKDVTMSYVNVEPYILTNVMGTSRLFSWMRDKEGIEKIINFSTAAVLGANLGLHTHEYALYNPMNPYSGTKASQEIIGITYRNVYKLPIVSVRIDTPFGPWQPERNFIPTIIKNILKNKKVTLYKKWTNPEIYPASRHWVFTETIFKELINILLDKSEHNLYHIVGNKRSVKDIFDKINDIIGGHTEIDWINCKEDSITSDQHLEYTLNSIHADNRGQVTEDVFDEQIAETIAWYKKYFKPI